MPNFHQNRRVVLANPPRGAFVGPLDAYTTGLAGVWSVARRLLASYTGSLIRIRRDSDHDERDIGFDAEGNLDTAAITSFVSSNSAYMVAVYDQEGGNNVTQAVAASQPLLVSSGTLQTMDGSPAFYCDGSGVFMDLPVWSGSAASIYATGQHLTDPTSALKRGLVLGEIGATSNVFWEDGNIYSGIAKSYRPSMGNPASSLASPYLFSVTSASANYQFRVNSAGLYSSGSNIVEFGSTPCWGRSLGSAEGAYEGWAQELVWYQAEHGSTEWGNIEPILQP